MWLDGWFGASFSPKLTSKDGQLGLKPNVLSLTRGGLGKMVRTYLTLSGFGGNEFGKDNGVFTMRDPNDLLLTGDSDSLISGNLVIF
ncbi:hypothetical protein Tco_1343409 [Tanacetum coccineum]